MGLPQGYLSPKMKFPIFSLFHTLQARQPKTIWSVQLCLQDLTIVLKGDAPPPHESLHARVGEKIPWVSQVFPEP